MVEQQHPPLSRDNPWPGLDPFDERDRDYFHGRANESGELLRLVSRELLTVLFGRSGLGKTSLLKAGLFPLLREHDYLPVYVRLDHAAQAPPLRTQVLDVLRAACEADGVEAAPVTTTESLWSLFHRRDAEFWSRRNRPVIPVVVLDQLEEIFTLGQETDAARTRSAGFFAELGDLIENRSPAEVKQALESVPEAALRFDFKRPRVKLILSLREDFLAEMEALKGQIPSLMYNRFRLQAMNGSQAYEVITLAGGHLVDDGVARRIIGLAWRGVHEPPVDPAAFPNMEIDPALLSVVCTELNHKRRDAMPPLDRITPALLEGADREILSGFYERSMAGLDPRVRALVEDELITDRGYRDSHALEDALAIPGVSRDALDALIARRLLRVDERQSVRRLELTHDVLTGVVKDSRDNRRAREAEAAARARELVALDQQRRNRRNAVLVLASALVVIGLGALAVWFWWNARLEREHAAQETQRAQTEQQRADAQTKKAEAEQSRAEGLLSEVERAQDAAKMLQAQARQEKERADELGHQADAQKRRADQLLKDAEVARLMAYANRLQGSMYDVSLLCTLEASRIAPSFDVQAGLFRLLMSHPHLSAFLSGHKEVVGQVAVSSNGLYVASASWDGTVILWDVASRQAVATLKGHKGKVLDVAFSPDGKWLASAGVD